MVTICVSCPVSWQLEPKLEVHMLLCPLSFVSSQETSPVRPLHCARESWASERSDGLGTLRQLSEKEQALHGGSSLTQVCWVPGRSCRCVSSPAWPREWSQTGPHSSIWFKRSEWWCVRSAARRAILESQCERRSRGGRGVWGAAVLAGLTLLLFWQFFFGPCELGVLYFV